MSTDSISNFGSGSTFFESAEDNNLPGEVGYESNFSRNALSDRVQDVFDDLHDRGIPPLIDPDELDAVPMGDWAALSERDQDAFDDLHDRGIAPLIDPDELDAVPMGDWSSLSDSDQDTFDDLHDRGIPPLIDPDELDAVPMGDETAPSAINNLDMESSIEENAKEHLNCSQASFDLRTIPVLQAAPSAFDKINAENLRDSDEGEHQLELFDQKSISLSDPENHYLREISDNPENKSNGNREQINPPEEKKKKESSYCSCIVQ